MANNTPAVPGLLDHILTMNQKKAPKGRRFRHCRSAPAAQNVGHKLDGIASLQSSNSIYDKLRPSFRQVAIFLAIYLGLGTLCFSLVSHQMKGNKTNGVLDAVYFCVVTMTTVGYGDIVPNSIATKLLACAFVFTGMALIGLTVSKAADYLVEQQQLLLVKALHMDQQLGAAEILKGIETNRVKYKCVVVLLLLFVLIFVGTLFLVFVEDMNFIDAFYCVCCTITSLGYGDKSFSTEAGRIFAVFWILTSTICLAQFFLYVAQLNSESRQRSLVKWVINRRMTHVDLEAADLDDDGDVSLAEFLVYKLKEMGKISQEDISLVMQQFKDLDVDQTGTLSTSDIILAQPSENGSLERR